MWIEQVMKRLIQIQTKGSTTLSHQDIIAMYSESLLLFLILFFLLLFLLRIILVMAACAAPQ